MEFSPKSTALQTDNNDRKNQNGFFNPMQFESPEQQTPTPTKVEFGNIFTEEDELSEASENLESFEKKFPQAIIEKYSKKSKGKI